MCTFVEHDDEDMIADYDKNPKNRKRAAGGMRVGGGEEGVE
jgi:hypothetical protein